MRNNSLTEIDSTEAPVIKLSYISRNQILFFFVWPFGQMVNAVRNFRQPWSMTVFWLFCIYFGLVFVYADPTTSGGADSARYARNLIELHKNPYSFDVLWASLYSVETSYVDVYEPFITWLVALITGNPSFLFGMFAAIFGFFYVKNLWMVFSRISVKVDVIIILFMMAYALVNPLWNINGVRMWTAAQIFLYGNLLLFLYDERRGLFWSAASILVHFSFMFPVLILIVWRFVPRNAWLFFAFYLATGFVSEINLFEVRNALSFLPEVFQPRVKMYTHEAYTGAFPTQVPAIHVTLAENFVRWITYVWVIVAFIKRKHWSVNHKNYDKFFLFALFLGGFANLASNVPSGVRFVILANCLFYALFILLLGKNYLQFYWLKLITIPLITFSIIFKIRVGFDYAGFLTIAGNPLIALFVDAQTPLIDFVKDIF